MSFSIAISNSTFRVGRLGVRAVTRGLRPSPLTSLRALRRADLPAVSWERAACHHTTLLHGVKAIQFLSFLSSRLPTHLHALLGKRWRERLRWGHVWDQQSKLDCDRRVARGAQLPPVQPTMTDALHRLAAIVWAALVRACGLGRQNAGPLPMCTPRGCPHDCAPCIPPGLFKPPSTTCRHTAQPGCIRWRYAAAGGGRGGA